MKRITLDDYRRNDPDFRLRRALRIVRSTQRREGQDCDVADKQRAARKAAEALAETGL